ncbi:MAG TPA: outer membrane protein assembly factor BamA [Bacteroidales bacterium]|nr:outer membrane protein assembly factor BamA [Bacteroidales bacterium]HOD26766.1 outer membrane protein assembly factor BamA [Bacteroidales bacterium]HPB36164.1 outer membrane protein assembly factor BamA [Bacteroidales bacterium]HPN46395.1 outer membrane protein assembly factor BamA [Bacteroidales bacterium]HPY58108.1 outer membrane protein assembly factor BamA [Bacteroidales bacterium]
MNKTHSIIYRLLAGFLCVFCALPPLIAQEEALPEIYYSYPRELKIADIAVEGEGIDNYDDYVLIGLSGLSVGQIIRVPGSETSEAVKRFWRHGLFSDVKIIADKIEGNEIWLRIVLSPRPRISKINYNGMKKSEIEELEPRLNMIVGNQITPNIIDRAEILIKKHYDGKGYKNADVNVLQRDDPESEDQVIIDINVDKQDKVKVNQLIIEGNEAFPDGKVKWTMKKTNEKNKLINFFRTKKFVDTEYLNDKIALIEKYNEYGYRDAVIVEDTVYRFDDNTVNVYLKVDEGRQYFIRDISWVGNTLYSSEELNMRLQIEKGDVYNQKRLNERLHQSPNEDAVTDLYMDRGYLFFQAIPVEVSVAEDSIDLEIRLSEGQPASIKRININGNDRLYEHVIRRELYTKPGELFNKAALMRSAREIAQTGHFDPETMGINPIPNEDGTVDIDLNLTSKSNDQVEFSLGWGSTGIVGSIGLKFTNFSMRNLLRLGEGVLPQGDGQTFSITGRTNGQYYQSYSFSFMEPWLGGKKPNSFSFSGYYSYQTGVSNRYYENYYSNYMMHYATYGNTYDYGDYYLTEMDPTKYIKMWGLSAGLGTRLTWPDDYFHLFSEFSYQHYNLENWMFFLISNGRSNDLSLNFTLSRNSTDNPLYTRSGSSYSLSLGITPPFSLLDNKTDEDYKKMSSQELYNWIEYYKIRFRSRTYTPLSGNRKLVMATRFDIGLLGAFNQYKRSPFGTFYMGGDGMTGYSSSYAYDIIALRGYGNGDLGVGWLYQRAGLELRYPLLMEQSATIYASAFLEAGNLWSDFKHYSPFELKRSAGVGVRIFIPIVGLLGIDWAYGFDPVGTETKAHGGEFHFVIGQEF